MDAGVGTTLRETRNRRKIDLSEVEAATKIRVRYLRAIENEEWDLLPGDAYARGFVRTYAAYLGLDAERLAEQQRRRAGATRPAERLPRVDSAPTGARRRRELPSPPPRLLAVVVSVALVAALVAIGLSSGGGGRSQPSSPSGGHPHKSHAGGGHTAKQAPARASKPLSLRLAATAEVWVCLLDAKGTRLVDGQILAAGSEAGPFRSGSFTFSLGNGGVKMTVDGEQVKIPETSSPVGYRLGHGGKLHPLSEGERPTCA